MNKREDMKSVPSFRPGWSKKVNLDPVKEMVQGGLDLDRRAGCEAPSLVYGTFNKVYPVTTDIQQEYVFRTVLLVCPMLKTNNEVASMKVIEKDTAIPVANIVSYGSDKRIIEHEWILMNKVPGRDLGIAGLDLLIELKGALVRQPANYQAEVFNLRFLKLEICLSWKAKKCCA